MEASIRQRPETVGPGTGSACTSGGEGELNLGNGERALHVCLVMQAR